MQDVPYNIGPLPKDPEVHKVEVNRRQFDALVAEHQRLKMGMVERHERDQGLRRQARRCASFDALALEHERRKVMAKYAQQPNMIVTQPRPYPDTSSSDAGANPFRIPAAVLGAGAALMAAVVLLPLWAIVLATVVLAIAVYLGVLTADVCRTMVPASEVEQRKIDWIVNRELPPLPDRYTCLDCGRFPEDCVCDDEPRKPKVWTEPCQAAVQAMDDPSNNCIMCGFPVQDH